MTAPEAAFCAPCGRPLWSSSGGSARAPARRARARHIVRCAKRGPMQLGAELAVDPPVVLMPMAGVTNYPFRKLCREQGAGLCVAEVVHAAAVVAGEGGRRMRFGEDEVLRSAQLLGTDAGLVGAAAARLIAEQRVRHIALDFGCPTAAVLRRGGGAAITRDPALLAAVVRRVVEEARPHGVPVTAALRLGLSWIELTYPEAAQAAQDAGAAGVMLTARTADDPGDDGAARRSWPHVKGLARMLDVPVVGEADVFTAIDAVKLLSATGAAGVGVGQGCLGRPWLFRDLKDAVASGWASETTIPRFGFVARTVLRHLQHTVEWEVSGGGTERDAVRSMRKWYQWYFRGYNKLPHLFVIRLCKAGTVEEIEEIVREVDMEAVGYKYEKGVGAQGKMGYMELPKKKYVPPPKKKKSASQRGPTTMKGQIQKALRERQKAEKEEEAAKERRRLRRERFEQERTMDV